MPIKHHVGFNPEQLSRDLQDINNREARLALAEPIGRVVLHDSLMEMLQRLASDGPTVVVTPLVPALERFTAATMRNLADRGRTAENLRLPPEAPVQDRIYTPAQLLAALPYVRNLDADSAFSEVTVPYLAMDAPRYGDAYRLSLRLGDEKNPAYHEGYTLVGEEGALGPLNRSTFIPRLWNPTNPHSLVPIADITLAEDLLRDERKLFPDKLTATFHELLAPVLGSEVRVSPLQIINQAA